MKPLVIILSLACLALGVQLAMRHGAGGRGENEFAAVKSQLHSLSNEVAEARLKAQEESRLSSFLQTNLTERVAELTAASNSLNQTVASLAAVQNELKTAQESASKQAIRVTELEGQKDEMQT